MTKINVISRIVRTSLVVSGICFIAIIVGISAMRFFGPSCGPFDESRVSLTGTQWDIVASVRACTSFDAYEKIVAENITTRERRNLVEFPAVPQNVKVNIKNGAIVVAVPNLVEITSHADEFEGHKVLLSYVPKDDPEARANFLVWLHHPQDPRAIKWHEDMMKAAVVEDRTP
jgi:hypothetical protein